MSTGYLSGTGENKNFDTILKTSDLAVGARALRPGVSYDTISNDSIDQHLKVDVDLGENLSIRDDVPSAYKDTIGSPASGLSVLGVPTYGDGRSNVSTTWADDHEVTLGGELTYFKPYAMETVAYSALST